MDAPCKLYHVDTFHSRTFHNTYFSDVPGAAKKEAFRMPLKVLSQCLKDYVKGGILVDLCVGPAICHLCEACDFFKTIIILRLNDHCVFELKKWLYAPAETSEESGRSSSVTSKFPESDFFKAKKKQLAAAVKQVIRCRIEMENPTDPLVLPPSDCLITSCILEIISKDKDQYMDYFKKMSTFLKPRGCLILYGMLHGTFYTVEGDKFHVLNLDESFVKNAVLGEKFSIDQCEVFQRKSQNDLADYKAAILIVAHKEE